MSISLYTWKTEDMKGLMTRTGQALCFQLQSKPSRISFVETRSRDDVQMNGGLSCDVEREGFEHQMCQRRTVPVNGA